MVRVVTEGRAIGQTISGDGLAEYVIDDWYNLPAAKFCIDVDAQGVLDLYAETLARAVD